MPFKANADRRHHIPKQRYRATNSAAYDAALRQRGSLTVWFTEDAITAWKPKPRGTRGRPPRQIESLIGSVMALLGLDLAVPDHTTLSRWAETLQLPRPRSRHDGRPMHLLVDSTGLKLRGAGEWLHEKHGTKTRRAWRTLHIGTDADTGEIVAARLTDSITCDASQVGPLLDQVSGPVASFTADGAYDWCSVYDEVAKRHPDAAVVVPTRSDAVPSSTANTEPTQRDNTSISWQSRAAWAGRPPRATTGACWWRPTSVVSSG